LPQSCSGDLRLLRGQPTGVAVFDKRKIQGWVIMSRKYTDERKHEGGVATIEEEPRFEAGPGRVQPNVALPSKQVPPQPQQAKNDAPSSGGPGMMRLKDYLVRHFEQTFILLMLTATLFINYLVPLKLAFLNLYFLPIILGGYYLGKRKAALGAVFSILYVLIYVVQSPESFQGEGTIMDVYVHVAAWAGFLILSGTVVGSLQEKLTAEISASQQLNEALMAREQELEKVNSSLSDYNENLERKVQERTEELERSKKATEALKEKVEETLYSTMDSSVVKMIIEGRLRNEKRNLSVFFSDLSGFTTYSEQHPPEVVISDLNKYLGDMEPILLAYHGHIDKYMGDGIMAEFGAPSEYETYRLLAALSGWKMQEKARRKSYPWLMRIGIASGTTLTGLIGSKRQTYTAIGDVVNLASRLEKECAAGKLLVDRETYEGVSDFMLARKKRDIPAIDEDPEKERHLEELHAQLNEGTNDPEVYYNIGETYLQLREYAMALQNFEKALQGDSGSTKFKVAYAEAGLKLRESETISVKGKRKRIEAFEIFGMKDPLENRDKIPGGFYWEFKRGVELIQVPEDIILPIEALDGCIGHSKTVALLAFAIATKFDLSDREKSDLVNAAFVADIGKDIIPHHLLNRRGSLTASEFEVVRNHPVEGAKRLRKMGYENAAMLEIVLHSHEYFNGSGYPHGLQGENIPLGSRIIAVADAYDALTSKRAYRDLWEGQSALEEIRRGVEKGMYDPNVAEVLFKLLGT
jgi:HD-GYP domain-containing protein (c-di-GMP phosphodiesterase class II)